MGDMADYYDDRGPHIDYELMQGAGPVGIPSVTPVQRDRVQINREAKKGTEVRCPTCGKKFVKKSYQQVFCSYKGRNNCKDNYHNRESYGRASRALIWSQ